MYLYSSGIQNLQFNFPYLREDVVCLISAVISVPLYAGEGLAVTSLRLCSDTANVNCVSESSGILMKINVSVKILEGGQHVRVHSEFIAVVKLDILLSYLKTRQLSRVSGGLQ